MTGETLGYALLGAGILALVLYDLFTTVLHHWGGGGPFSQRVASVIWRCMVRLTASAGEGRRRRILGYTGPLLIPVVVILWAGGIILGFAFLYAAWPPGSFHAGAAITGEISLRDAFYYSGITFFTVGYGDVVPVRPGLRFVAMLQGGTGFALVTLVIGYFTSIYQAYSRQKVLAQSLYYQAGCTPDAAVLLAHHLAGDEADSLPAEVGRVRDGLVEIRTEFSNYPILHYFISAEPEQALVRLLYMAQDLGLLLDTVLDPARLPLASGLGGRLGLRSAAADVQDAVAETLLRRGAEHTREAADRAPHEEGWRERFRRARGVLREHGVAVREDEVAAEAYCRGRASWEPVLRACADALGQDWERVTKGA